ncbi:MAG TPA: hypothetical protein VK133_00005 [Amoebophilaceae bacterium]|nr:hypothetical protein [Amoebophilaceae bacterium]
MDIDEQVEAKLARINPVLKELAMSAAQRLRQEGRQEGEKLGILKGRQEGRQEGEKLGILKGKQEGSITNSQRNAQRSRVHRENRAVYRSIERGDTANQIIKEGSVHLKVYIIFQPFICYLCISGSIVPQPTKTARCAKARNHMVSICRKTSPTYGLAKQPAM